MQSFKETLLVVLLVMHVGCAARAPEAPKPEEMKRIADLENQGLSAESEQEIEKQFAQGNDSTDLRYAHGLSLLKRGKYPEAEQAFKRVLQMDDQYFQAWSDLGVVYDETGQLDEAVKAYDRALELNQHYFPALKNRGNTRRRLGDYAGAAADYRAALKQRADDYCTQGFLSFAAQASGQEIGVPRIWEAPEHRRDYYSCRGIAFAHAGDCPSAIASYTNAITMGIADSETYNNRGACFAALGEMGTALADFELAVKLNPRNFQAVNNVQRARAIIANEERR